MDGLTPAAAESMSETIRDSVSRCKVALHEWNGWAVGDEEDRRHGLFGPARSNRVPVPADGRVSVESPYPEPFWGVLVFWDRHNRPIMCWGAPGGPAVLGPGDSLGVDVATLGIVPS